MTSRKGKSASLWLSSLPIAHRGLQTDFPENSIGAVLAAFECGRPAEVDIRLSRDSSLVVIHDTDLYRVAGIRRTVRSLSASRLERIRILSTPETIPTLQALLETVPPSALLLLSVKPTRHILRATKELRRVLTAHGSLNDSDNVAVSFMDPVMYSVYRICDNNKHPVGLTTIGHVDGRPFRGVLTRLYRTILLAGPLAPDFLTVDLRALPDQRFERRARRRGATLIAWTVSDEASLWKVRHLGVNFMFQTSQQLPENLVPLRLHD